MSNSQLICFTQISPNKTKNRNHVIDTITIHCMACNATIERCGSGFANPLRRASSNYGIGSDGRIGLYVEEKDRSWCTSNSSNDHRAITIEVANDGKADSGWHVSDKALSSLIELCADICRRNNIKELKWKADKKLIGQVSKQNMTVHRWFAKKACPGDYLYNLHGYIAQEVNKKICNNVNQSVSINKASEPVKTSYVKNGINYSLVFDHVYYSNNNPDLKNAFGTNSTKLLNHFIDNGMKEGRQAIGSFNVLKYKNKYTDLQKVFGSNLQKYYLHYIEHGSKEGRTCN